MVTKSVVGWTSNICSGHHFENVSEATHTSKNNICHTLKFTIPYQKLHSLLLIIMNLLSYAILCQTFIPHPPLYHYYFIILSPLFFNSLFLSVPRQTYTRVFNWGQSETKTFIVLRHGEFWIKRYGNDRIIVFCFVVTKWVDCSFWSKDRNNIRKVLWYI